MLFFKLFISVHKTAKVFPEKSDFIYR